MPNTKPSVTTASDVAEKYLAIKGKAHIDYGLFCGLGERTRVDRAALVATAFKVYLGETTGNLGVDNDDILVKGLNDIMASGLPVSVHCEDPKALKDWKPPTGEPKDTIDYNRSRPEEIEAATVKKLAGLKDVKGLHIAHLSSRLSLEAKPADFTSEVTPHHMFLNERMGLKARGKMNPPLRSLATASDLWRALVDGRIDLVASDHAPHTIEEKDLRFVEAPAGVPGVETMLPLLLHKLRNNELHIERLVRIVSQRAAEVFKLPTKGRIEVGMDADIITVDLRAAGTIKARNLHSKCGWTPYEGMPAVFPRRVFLRGQQVVQDWEFVGDASWGQPLSRAKEGPKQK
jgi:dihydroorotase